MLFFGHVGITAGIFYAASKFFRKKIDYRFVVLGSLLPDIIDKPLGLIILGMGNGRIIAHTAIFALAITAIALYKKDIRFYAISGSVWLHLLFDFMWLFPATLLWPLMGSFLNGSYTIYMIPNSFFADSFVTASEIAGLFIIIFLIMKNRLYKRENFMTFLKSGKLKSF